MYSCAVDINDCLVSGSSDTDPVRFEPGQILATLPSPFLDYTHELCIFITDGRAQVELSFNSFLSKTYLTKDGKMKIGYTELSLNNLSVAIQWKVILEPLSRMTDDSLQ
jgi:hypothetical protein